MIFWNAILTIVPWNIALITMIYVVTYLADALHAWRVHCCIRKMQTDRRRGVSLNGDVVKTRLTVSSVHRHKERPEFDKTLVTIFCSLRLQEVPSSFQAICISLIDCRKCALVCWGPIDGLTRKRAVAEVKWFNVKSNTTFSGSRTWIRSLSSTILKSKHC